MRTEDNVFDEVFTNKRDERKQKAAARQAERDSRSDAEQLAKLIENGHGHCKEAERLAKSAKK